MKKIFSLALIFALLISCKTDYFSEIDSNELKSTKLKFKENNTQRNFYGVVLSTTGAPISGAKVFIGDDAVSTNSEGFFSFKNAHVNDSFAYIKVEKNGYIDGSRTVVPTEGDNRINIMMIPETITSTISSGTHSTVSLPNGTEINFDGNFKDEYGNPYNGSVNVGIFDLASSNMYLNELMPGSFLANDSNGNPIVMDTYGMVHVQLSGSSGEKLQIADGHTAEMTTLIDPQQLATAPATIPLWSFNEVLGIWEEEGLATRVGNTYVGTVSHFSWWNYDVPFPVCELNFRVLNSSGDPLANTKVSIKMLSQSYDKYSITDSYGFAAGLVPADEALEVGVYDNCGNLIYNTNVGPFSTGSKNTIPDIILPPDYSHKIVGTLKTCSGANVINGIVNLKYVNSGNYFNDISAVVNNGNFVFYIVGCNIAQDFKIQGMDLSNGNSSGKIHFTAVNPATNVGIIFTCAAATEFVSYQIDNQPIENCFLGFTAGLEGGGLYVHHNQSVNIPSTNFLFLSNNINSVGTYTSGFTVNIGSEQIPALGNNLEFKLNQFGAIGDYIDFTIDGTYTDTAGFVRNLSVTGHVIRDF